MPLVSEVVVMLGAAVIMTVEDVDIDVSETEVAVTFTAILEETAAGAL